MGREIPNRLFGDGLLSTRTFFTFGMNRFWPKMGNFTIGFGEIIAMGGTRKGQGMAGNVITEEERKYGIRITFNECSRKLFRELPEWLQLSIASVQKAIQRSVLQKFSKARATSGFRCSCENRRVGGVGHSRHLFGLARDYALDGDFPRDIPGCKVIPSKNCFHVELVNHGD